MLSQIQPFFKIHQVDRSHSMKLGYACALFFALLLLFFLRPEIKLEMNLTQMLALPSTEHWLGTDSMGRDVLFRLGQAFLWTIVPVWILALVCNGLSVVLFVAVERLNLTLRGLSVAVFQLASWGTLLPVTIAVFATTVFLEKTGGLALYVPLAVILLMRSLVVLKLQLKESERLQYWQAHDSLGGSLAARIMKYGVVYGWRNTLLAQTAADMRMVVIVEASLSYLGFGVAEPTPSLGNMLSAHFSNYLHGSSFVTCVVVAFMCVVLLLPSILLQPLAIHVDKTPEMSRTRLKNGGIHS